MKSITTSRGVTYEFRILFKQLENSSLIQGEWTQYGNLYMKDFIYENYYYWDRICRNRNWGMSC